MMIYEQKFKSCLQTHCSPQITQQEGLLPSNPWKIQSLPLLLISQLKKWKIPRFEDENAESLNLDMDLVDIPLDAEVATYTGKPRISCSSPS
mmetsp:Transcript_445/g.726  ORF Transcript_445/g.726 Transcript_445/m.726 type:complete len:92 (+) Transcript_445:19-294(+)